MKTSFREYFTRTWGERGQIQIDFLDTIDFSPYLVNGVRLDKIREEIEDKYDYGFMRDKIPPELHQCAFNCIDDYEFGWYLEDRYPEIRVDEQVEAWYEIRLKR